MADTSYILLAVFALLAAKTYLIHIEAASKDETASRTKFCDFYFGKWVYDRSYPLYISRNCPFIVQQFNCLGNGRPDGDYEKYRWQPNNCNLPRWNGKDFIRRFRGKRMMLVGDSLSMNQWQSLACMVLSSNPRALYTTEKNGLVSTIAFPKFNFTLMYARNALIVDIDMENDKRVLKLDSVAGSAKLWLTSDILVFDTWHWWLHTGRKQPWDIIRDGRFTHQDMDRLAAYKKALTTWARWVDQNVDTRKVKIFFQGVSPDHWNANEWGKPELERCGGERQPLALPMLVASRPPADIVLEDVLRTMKKPIFFLNITALSQFRVDAHPSLYGNPKNVGMDCTHWCLPGVPDVWNELLYATLGRDVNRVL